MSDIPRKHRQFPRDFCIFGGLALLAVLAVPGQERRRADYLSPQLRTRVEKLKAEAAAPSESAPVLLERLQTLWEWSNAYALTGGPIPPNYPAAIATANRTLRGAPRGGREIPLDRLSAAIATYTSEFKTKDENPGALGTVTLSKPGPFLAGDYLTVEETYTAGSTPIAKGGGVATSTRAAIQTDDRTAEGYVSVRSTNPAAKFRAMEPWGGDWAGLIYGTTIAFRLVEGDLRPGDKVIFTFGDTSGGGKGMRLQTWANDRFILPLYIDLEGKGLFLTPAWPPIRVQGRPDVKSIWAVAPSTVRTNEAFEVAVRGEDVFRNPSSGKLPVCELLLDQAVVREIPAGSKGITVVSGLRAATPGVHRFTVRSKDGSLKGVSNPVVASANPGARIYWGDTHGHCGFAEGQGSPDNYYSFGRDVARLDFLVLSEHDLWMDDWEWSQLQEMTRKYLAPGKFTPILGYEWTSDNTFGGHHNVYFRTAANRRRVPVQAAINLDELYAGLNKQYDPNDVLVIPHAHNSGDWTKSDGTIERLAEITSGHGTFEYFGNKYLQNGFDVGFVGSGDNHVGHPGGRPVGGQQQGGIAAVLAPENTPEAIFTALRSRSAYATTGERIVLDVSLNGGRMGQRLPDNVVRKISARVYGTAPIDSVDVIKNGKVVFQKRYLSGKIDGHTLVQLRFDSSTEVFSRANPRGARPWNGDLTVSGAKLVRITAPDFLTPRTEGIQRDSANPNHATFAIQTRGRGKGILLELEGAGPSTEISVRVQAAREGPVSGGVRHLDAPLARLAADDMKFRLGEFHDGLATHEQRFGTYVTSAQAQLTPLSAPLDQVFEYADRETSKPGDYYYVRAVQVDGAMAWSSPFWVGGQAKPALRR